MKTTTDFREFMSFVDWNELDINEKRALVEAARYTEDVDLGLFRTRLVDKLQDKTVLEFPLCDIGIELDILRRKEFITFIENTYMGGEDADSYISWLEEIEDEEIIKMRTAQISMLPPEQVVFLKKINLANAFMSGVVCYARKIADNYTMSPLKKTKEEHLFFGYKEEEYPSDDLDKAIINEIKLKFSNAVCQTSLMMFNTEYENHKNWIQQLNKETYNIRVEYIPNTFSSQIPPQIYSKEIISVFYPLPEDKQKRLNSDIIIVTNDIEKYRRFVSTLEDSYLKFDDVIK